MQITYTSRITTQWFVYKMQMLQI